MAHLQKYLKEPLVHFILIGALVFGAHSLWQARQLAAERTIIISQPALQRLSTLWAAEAGRDPTADDVRGLLAEYVREEVLYREAKRLGLDEDDTIVRRRLAQKMGFLLSNDAGIDALDEADLRALYAANPETYREPPRISFEHVPFNFAANGKDREAEIEAASTVLKGADPVASGTLGDAFMLARVHTDIDETSLARLFGRDFASDVFALPQAKWSAPMRSRLADHLVRITARSEGGLPPFESVIDAVRTRETERLKRTSDAAALEDIVSRYEVIIEDGSAS